jgi:serine protease Do
VTETRVLQRLIASAGAGRDVRLTILRAEGRRRLDVKLASMPRSVVGERVGAEFGFVVREPETAGPSALSVVTVPTVSVIVPRSPADRAGLEVGDVILQVGERVVLTRDEVREALADASLEMPLRLTLGRGANRLSVTLRPPGGA